MNKNRIFLQGIMVIVFLSVMLCGMTSGVNGVEKPQRYIETPKAGEQFSLIVFLESQGYIRCPEGTESPPGSVNIWDRSGTIAHSSVVLPGDRQIEMGHKPGGSKYVSEILPPGQNPKPNQGEYELMGTWCPPSGSIFNVTRAMEMNGTDREYDNKTTHWNCHGFSANVVYNCVNTPESIEDDQWVVWYAEKIGFQPIYVTTYSSYKAEEPSCSYPGGGLDCTVMLEKTFVLGPYSSREEATEAICSQLTNFRRMRGIYAGLPVADYMGQIHNIEPTGCGPEYWG